MFEERGKEGHDKRSGKEEQGDLQLEGVDQPEGEVHQDEQTHCLAAGMRILAFPEKTTDMLTVWKGFETKI